MKNNISIDSLNTHLFEAIEMLKTIVIQMHLPMKR